MRSPGTSSIRRVDPELLATSRLPPGGAQRRRLRRLSLQRLQRRSRVPGGGARLGDGGGAAWHGACALGQAGRSVVRFRRCLQALHRRHSVPLVRRFDRGSAGELVARCIVETGTSSYYSGVMEAAEEPVLKESLPQHRRRRVPPLQAVLHLSPPLPGGREDRIIRSLLGGRLAHPRIGGRRTGLRLLRRQSSGRRRLRPQALRSRLSRSRLCLYRPPHIERGIGMILKAIGMEPQGRLNGLLTRLGMWFIRRNAARFTASEA